MKSSRKTLKNLFQAHSLALSTLRMKPSQPSVDLKTVENFVKSTFEPMVSHADTPEVFTSHKVIDAEEHVKDATRKLFEACIEELYNKASNYYKIEESVKARKEFANLANIIKKYKSTYEGDLSDNIKVYLSKAVAFEALFVSPIYPDKIIKIYEEALSYDPENIDAKNELSAIKIASKITPTRLLYPDDPKLD